MFVFWYNKIFINKILKKSSRKDFKNAAWHFINQSQEQIMFSMNKAKKSLNYTSVKYMKIMIISILISGCNSPFLCWNQRDDEWSFCFFHRVNCAVFILIRSFKDFVNVSRCSIQIRIKQIHCAYALSKHQESQMCNIG